MKKAASTMSSRINTGYQIHSSYNAATQYGEFHSSRFLKSGKEFNLHYFKF